MTRSSSGRCLLRARQGRGVTRVGLRHHRRHWRSRLGWIALMPGLPGMHLPIPAFGPFELPGPQLDEPARMGDPIAASHELVPAGRTAAGSGACRDQTAQDRSARWWGELGLFPRAGRTVA